MQLAAALECCGQGYKLGFNQNYQIIPRFQILAFTLRKIIGPAGLPRMRQLFQSSNLKWKRQKIKVPEKTKSHQIAEQDAITKALEFQEWRSHKTL